jgi:hypothetical protein
VKSSSSSGGVVVVLDLEGNVVFFAGRKASISRYGHTIKFTPHPIPNCEVKLDGPVQYWGGGPPGKFVVLYLLFFPPALDLQSPHSSHSDPLIAIATTKPTVL